MKRLLSTLGLALLTLGSSCQTPVQDQQIISASLNNDLSADAVAMVLLDETDVVDATTAVRPQTVQFNDHLDPIGAETISDFFVSRAWWDELTSEVAIQNAITKYKNSIVAQEQIIALAGDNTPVEPAVAVGDAQLVYEDELGFTYRFTMGVYGVRVSAYSLTIATDLAKIQADKLADLGHAPSIELPNNTAVQHLPATVVGGTLLGTANVTTQQWLGTIYDLTSADIPGFVSGGLRRWQMTDRPQEVVEITVLEMDTVTTATDLVSGLLPSSDVGIEIELPASIASVADAVDNAHLVELQAGVDNYFVDITILAPFGELDVEAAKADLITIAEAVITDFAE